MKQKIVFDIGMNNGDDTEYYLKLGLRVVAIEANPLLTAQCAIRFATQIKDGHLVILNKAISTENNLTKFYINNDNNHWSSSNKELAVRSNSSIQEINIETLDIASIIDSNMNLYYIKIDIEGADITVLEQLSHAKLLPKYLSIEDCYLGPKYILNLKKLGYSKFKLSDQSKVCDMETQINGFSFNLGSSGPFGPLLNGPWYDYEDFILVYGNKVRGPDLKRIAPLPTWWDIHCSA